MIARSAFWPGLLAGAGPPARPVGPRGRPDRSRWAAGSAGGTQGVPWSVVIVVLPKVLDLVLFLVKPIVGGSGTSSGKVW